jgi:hypothetical protein
MVQRLLEGFSHYTSTADIILKWTARSNLTVSASGGRFGGGSASLPFGSAGYVYETFDNQATWIAGVAYAGPAATNQVIVAFMDAGSAQVELRLNTSNQVVVTRNGTVLGTSVATVNPAIYNYYELKATIHNTTGAYEVQVNGASVLSGSGANTRNTANNYANQVSFCGSPATAGTNLGLVVCDIYVFDGTGSVNNTFAGEVRVQTSLVTGAGNYAQFTPSTGSNFQNVDESVENGDTDYNSSSTVNQIDSFAMADLVAGTQAPKGVQVTIVWRKDDAGVRQGAALLRIGGADYVGNTVTLGSAYSMAMQEYDTNPATAAAWTASDVNGMEAGYKLVA